MNFQDKIKQAILRVGLKHTTVDFKNFIKKDDKYYYHVKIFRPDFYDKYDRVNLIELDNKVERFNKIIKRELKYADVIMTSPTRISQYDSFISLTLRADFIKEVQEV